MQYNAYIFWIAHFTCCYINYPVLFFVCAKIRYFKRKTLIQDVLFFRVDKRHTGPKL